MSKLIRNGRQYPKAMKTAVLATWTGTQRSTSEISKEFNISDGTVSKWVAEANLQRGTQHPRLKAGIQRHLDSLKDIKEFNTPTAVKEGNVTVIKYQGKIYR
jgi:transposase-like protein